MDGAAWKRREASVIPTLLPTALVLQQGAVFGLVSTDQPTHSYGANAGLTARTVGVAACGPSPLSSLALAVEGAHARPFGRICPTTVVSSSGLGTLARLAVRRQPSVADIELLGRLRLVTSGTALVHWPGRRGGARVVVHHGVLLLGRCDRPSARVQSAPGPLPHAAARSSGRTPDVNEAVNGTCAVPLGSGGTRRHARSASPLLKRVVLGPAGTGRDDLGEVEGLVPS
jgi:hypothetical protein